MNKEAFLPGFADPVRDSTETFRVLMNAMAHPGRIHELPVLATAPPPLYGATASVCLTLLDLDTPLWIDGPAAFQPVVDYLQFHCGCSVVSEPGEAAYAIVGDGSAIPDFRGFRCGDPSYPDQSATLLIQVESLSNSQGTRLRGPGIESEIRLHAAGLSGHFWQVLRESNGQFPLGVDVLLVSPASICALPRTVEVLPGD